MKICNNCGTENGAAAQRCIHCHMVGQFSHRVPAGQKNGTDKREIQCRNCGSFEPGSASKCDHCHFPLPDHTLSYPFTKLSLQANLRAG